MRRFVRILVLVCCFAAGLIPATGISQSGVTVREVVVEGAQRIEPETVRSYLLIQEGDVFDAQRIDRSLKSLFATGLFADVAIGREGDSLVVTVIENPVVNRIAFEGNRKIDDEELSGEITLRPRIIYTRTTVQNDVKRILTLYRRNGRFATTVEPKVIRLPQNRVDLVFEVDEGDATEIESIRFVGNRKFGDSRLREVIRTKETRWWRLFSADDTYDPDRLTLDRELLRRFYLNNGHADFRTASAIAELTPDRKDFFLTFTIDEGPRYRFGAIEFDLRLRGLTHESIAEAIEVESGDWYDGDAIEQTIDALTDKIGTLGYAFVDVRPRINRNRDEKTVEVTFEINEGPRVFVERIEISGNVRTQDDVIRREFRLVEGDAFNTAKLRRSRQRIQNLDFFESLVIEQVPGSTPDKTVVTVDVEEKSTGSFSVGAGFSTSNGILGDIGLREKNLLGKGQDLRLNALIAAKKSQINLSFTEPYFLDRDVAAGFDVFRIAEDRQDASSFDSETTGFALRAGYPFTEALSQRWKYTLERTDVTNIATGASLSISEEESARTLSSITHAISYDIRNSRLSPTEGYFARFTTDLAGLGGTTRFLRNRLDAAQHFTVLDEWVMSFFGSTGYIVGLGEDVRLIDRFFIGGDDLRGFVTGSVGPRDVDSDDALGGQWMYTATAQLTFPLGLPNEFGIKGKVFSDLGSAGEIESSASTTIRDTGSLRASVGAGLNWVSPFGPIGLDFGFPVLQEDFDKTENLRINFGTRF